MMKNITTSAHIDINRNSKRIGLGAILAAMLIGIIAPLANADPREQGYALTSATNSNLFLQNSLTPTGEFKETFSGFSTETPKFNLQNIEDYQMPDRHAVTTVNGPFQNAPLVGPTLNNDPRRHDLKTGFSSDPFQESMFLNQAGTNGNAPTKKQTGLLGVKF